MDEQDATGDLACGSGAQGNGGAATLPEAQGARRPASIDVQRFETPSDELFGIADLVRSLIDEGFAAADVYVAAPNGTWVKNVGGALRTHGVAVDVYPSDKALDGNFADPARCQAPLMLAALDLAAKPDDALALRMWCAAGDHMAASPTFKAVRERVARTGETLAQALRTLQDETATSAAPIYNVEAAFVAYEAAQDIGRRCRHLRGQALLEEIARLCTKGESAQVSAVLAACCAPVTETSTAVELAANVREHVMFPTFDAHADAVRVGPYEALAGLNPRMVILAGFVNGFFPIASYFDAAKLSIEKRARLHAPDAHRPYAVATKAGERLCATYFTKATPQMVTSLKLKMDRIRMRDGHREYSVSASEFLKVIQCGEQ